MASEAEGFICPYCLVTFANPSKLQTHFVEMHSGQGQVDDLEAIDNGSSDNGEDAVFESPQGHQFRLRRLNRPCTCDVCGEIIWQDAILCQLCQITLHQDKCEEKLEKPCVIDADEPLTASQEAGQRSTPPQAAKGILPLVRRQVAKGRDRYVNEQFDLDLTYITERIIAMSYPASGVESTYRNNLKDVAKMLRTKHQENYMIFNLSERSYDISKFNNQVLDFGWPDHLAPSLERLSSVCKSMKSWLDSDPLHVAVVHCKGGKGRTGCVIAAFMHYSAICESAQAALDRFAMKRFYDNKLGGVTQPSQRKYVHYFADLLSGKVDLHSPPVVLNHVIIHGIPNYDGKGGCRPYLKVYENMKLVHTSGLYVCTAEKERVKISMYRGLKLQGETLIKCFHKKLHKGLDSVFRCQFHTAVITHTHRLVLGKDELDDSFKDKRFPESTRVELIFQPWSGEDKSKPESGPEFSDLRTALLSAPSRDLLKAEPDESAKRDSYTGFLGGYDTGRPGDEVPDLMQFAPGKHERIESSSSFHMDPEHLERVAPPHSEQLYTVISKPLRHQNSQEEGLAEPGGESKPKGDSPKRSKGPPPSRPPPPTKRPSESPPLPSGKPTRPPPPAKPPSTKPPSSNPPPPSKPPTTNPPLPTNPPTTNPLRVQVGMDEDYAEIYDEVEDEPEAKPFKQIKQIMNPPRPAAKPRTGRKKFSYDEINIDQRVVLEQVPVRQSAQDNEMWMRVKFQTLPTPRADSISRLSSSSSNLTSSDYYSNLADLSLTGGFVGESQRRHSFSSGDDRIVIHGAPDRESIIPLGPGGSEPEYTNVGVGAVGGEEEAVYADPDEDDRTRVLARQKPSGALPPWGQVSEVPRAKPAHPYVNSTVKEPQPQVSGANGEEPGDHDYQNDDITDQDYENQDSEGMFHIYANESDLMAQFRQQNLPTPDQSREDQDTPPQPQQQSHSHSIKGPSSLLKLLIPSFGRQKQSEIHSAKITQDERIKTLAPFELSGIQVDQVNRDYEAFFKTSAWGEQPRKQNRSADAKPKVLPLFSARNSSQATPTPANGAVLSPEREERRKGSPVAQRRKKVPLRPPGGPSQSQLSPLDATSPVPAHPHPARLHSPQLPRKSAHPPIAKKPSAPLLITKPTPAPKPSPASRPAHSRLQGQSSVDPAVGRSREYQPSSSEGAPVPRKKTAPPKPPPYFASDPPKPASESMVKSMMPYWYRPNITREEAIDFVRHMEPGSFIVRDSQTVSGGYALTIKVSEHQVRQRRKLAEDAAVTEDMCVTHFLIQPDPEGVKLQGWNERAFKSLPEFIAQHMVEKLCLPCRLVLQKGGQVSRRKPATMKEALITGAACDLVYLGSMDVPGPGSESLLGQTVQQLKSCEPTINIVTFKASKDGVTLTDNINGMYIKRQYPISSVTYCGLDPNDTRWDFPSLQYQGDIVSLKNKPCFGVFYRNQDTPGYSCLVFAELDSSQPVGSVTNYVQKIMKQRHK